jgi:hypothetical protein
MTSARVSEVGNLVEFPTARTDENIPWVACIVGNQVSGKEINVLAALLA